MEAAMQSLGNGEWLLRLREWTEFVHPDAPGRAQLLRDEPDVRAQLDALSATSALELDLLRGGLRIRTSSFIGRVRVGPLTIVIEPKIDRAPMLALLRYGFGLRGVRTFDETTHRAAAPGFEDLVAMELAAEAAELASRGLQRRYVARREDLAAPRGRIEFGRLACAPRTAASLPCRHHLRSGDTPLNRAVLMGLGLAHHVCHDPDVRGRLHWVREAFAEVSDPRPARTVLAAALRDLDRTTHSYEPVLRLVDLLLEGSGVVLGEGRPVPLRGFLFDLNRLFQALLGRFLRENLIEAAVIEERPLRGMLRWDPDQNPLGLKDPLPRPDFAVHVKGEPPELLDAKYQDLAARPPSREVVYQLAMYALSRDASGRATILFPGRRSVPEQALIVCTPTHGEEQARVTLRAVDLEYVHNLLATPGAWRDRATYARWLAFGTRISRQPVRA